MKSGCRPPRARASRPRQHSTVRRTPRNRRIGAKTRFLRALHHRGGCFNFAHSCGAFRKIAVLSGLLGFAQNRAKQRNVVLWPEAITPSTHTHTPSHHLRRSSKNLLTRENLLILIFSKYSERILRRLFFFFPKADKLAI